MKAIRAARALTLGFLILECNDPADPSYLLQISPIMAVVNGQPWRLSPPDGDTIGDCGGPRRLEFGGVDSTGPKLTTIAIMIWDAVDTGSYILGDPSAPASGSYAILTPPPDLHTTAYETDAAHGGSVHLVIFDALAQFVQGTFAFKAISGTQVVTVTKGRFRGHYFKFC